MTTHAIAADNAGAGPPTGVPGVLRAHVLLASASAQEGPQLARRGIDSSQRLGRHRYMAERSLARLVGYRRLPVPYEQGSDFLLGFLQLACALTCRNSLDRPKL